MFQNGFRCFEMIESVNSRWIHLHMVDIPICVFGTNEARERERDDKTRVVAPWMVPIWAAAVSKMLFFLFSHAGKCSSPE